MRVLPCGDRALIAEFDTLDQVLAAHARWSAELHVGIVELVPAARTVLVRIDPSVWGLGALEQWLVAHPSADGGDRASWQAASQAAVTLPVDYDGDDLAVVAEAWGCSPDDVVARHVGTTWVCAFIGFAPGFPYLVPTDGAALPSVPRRATSRPRVPAGAVALAAEYCGVYPRASPGGWQLIGRTDAAMWDADRAAPALVTPGTLVRFEKVRP